MDEEGRAKWEETQSSASESEQCDNVSDCRCRRFESYLRRQLEQITTVDKRQILEFVGEIPVEIMEQVDNAIKISLALE